jgi:uncharacterized membrane protein
MIDPHPVGEASTHHTPAHALERLIFFSDAVFAISITLLVIELHPPTLKFGSPGVAYVQALADLIPNFIGFFVSFFVIGAFWSGHHRAFSCARHWSPGLLMPNLFLLCSIAAMPFFTAFMADNARNHSSVPTVVYCIWLLIVAVCNLWNNSMAVAPPVAAVDLDPEYAHMIRRRGWAVILGAGTALVVGWFEPWLAQPALASMPLWRLVIERIHKRGLERLRRTAA